jgi:hypothetical protein
VGPPACRTDACSLWRPRGPVTQWQVAEKFLLCSQVLLLSFRFSAASVFSFFWRSLALFGFVFDSVLRWGLDESLFLFLTFTGALQLCFSFEIFIVFSNSKLLFDVRVLDKPGVYFVHQCTRMPEITSWTAQMRARVVRGRLNLACE